MKSYETWKPYSGITRMHIDNKIVARKLLMLKLRTFSVSAIYFKSAPDAAHFKSPVAMDIDIEHGNIKDVKIKITSYEKVDEKINNLKLKKTKKSTKSEKKKHGKKI